VTATLGVGLERALVVEIFDIGQQFVAAQDQATVCVAGAAVPISYP